MVQEAEAPRPDDLGWCIEYASEYTGVAECVLYGLGYVESRNQHYDADGSVKRGDGGKARGWGQIHHSPWEAWASEQLERDVDLDVLQDNVLVAALIIKRYLDRHDGDLATALGHYNGGPYCNLAYANKVLAAINEHKAE